MDRRAHFFSELTEKHRVPVVPVPLQPGPDTGVRLDLTSGLDVTTSVMDATRATVQLAGELDLSTAGLLTAVINGQLRRGRCFLCLDISRLAFVDCAGLREIAAAHNACLGVRGTLVLTGVSERIARLLAITHLDEGLFVADGADEPPRSRRRPQRARHLSAVTAQ
jgi:anti-sigma B factor antagonist